MADIFISYSSRDRKKAEQLIELLSSAGLSCWIDQSGIDVATSWSGEIVDAIDGCKALVVLLSSTSVQSKNVIREVALAFEKNKKILPLDLEPVVLTRDLQYHLAGIQRAQVTNIDAIIRALGKLGLEATQAPNIKLVKEADIRKSLMVLPFEDLSPTADNGWFADGIVSELIGSLSAVKKLRLANAQMTKEFKNYKGHLTVYAREMSIRYFILGSVRKFGDQIKITSQLLDIETGEYLWQDSLKGTMQDIFDIQETVALKVTSGLNIILTSEESRNVAKKLTENPEAYELYLKGSEYFTRHTRADYEHAIGLFEEAARLDPEFAYAHISVAHTTLEYFRQFSRDQKLLEKADEYINRVEPILGESKEIFWIKSALALACGNYQESLDFALRSVELDPNYPSAYNTLCNAYQALGRFEEAAEASKRQLQLAENDRAGWFNYLVSLMELGDGARLVAAARDALPVFERYLRLTPDDVIARVSYANILSWAREKEHAISEAKILEGMEGLDARALYNLACLYLREEELSSGIQALRKSVEKGFRNLEDFLRDPDLDPLRGEPEFKELMKVLEVSNG